MKIKEPEKLARHGLTEADFGIWKDELEVFLSTNAAFDDFLPGGKYSTWEPSEKFTWRIRHVVEGDNPDNLRKIQKNLRQVLSITARYIHKDHYAPIMKLCTSFEWIYKRVRKDHNIQRQGIFFLNIAEINYDPNTDDRDPIGLYNNYRSLVIENMYKTGDKINSGSETFTEDEVLTASHENLIFLNVLMLIHKKLPAYIKKHFSHKIGKHNSILDYQTEILTNAKQYIEEIENEEATLNAIHQRQPEQDPQCNYMSTNRNSRGGRGRGRYQTPYRYQNASPRTQKPFPQSESTRMFCILCYRSGTSKQEYTNHRIGEPSCKSMSQKDKDMLLQRATAQLNNITLDDDHDLMAENGYELDDAQHSDYENKVTTSNSNFANHPENKAITDKKSKNENIFSECKCMYRLMCNHIKPVPTQTLTCQDKPGNNIFLDLDTGATVSYAKYDMVKKFNFSIKPNYQLCTLADGITKMECIGEIDETFYINQFKIRFHAVVVEKLHCSYVAGNNFMLENKVVQNIANKTITIHNKYVIPETNKMLLLPTLSNTILRNNSIKVVLPGQQVMYKLAHKEGEKIAVQACFQNKQAIWPTPQICKVSNNHISVTNETNDIIHLKNGNDRIQACTLSDKISENKCFISKAPKSFNSDQYKNVEINKVNIPANTIQRILDINEKYKSVFDENLSKGYNMAFGKHYCRLNWASQARPQANKISNINYDYDTKVLLQQVIDDFTAQGVLGIPQNDNVSIQHVSPAFLVRKQRAKNVPKSELTAKHMRMVVNFSNLNEYLKNIPFPVTKQKDIFTHLGRWKYIITIDLFQGFFQNILHPQDGQWLGISSPFGGLRYFKRSAQGLIGQSEELDELLTKVLGPEMKLGFTARIADDLYVGGSSPEEAADNYEKVIHKLHAANLKISADKTKIFLNSVDILGWSWKTGGFLSPSPHRILTLKNTSASDIKTIKDLRSFLGLYKTLIQASPNLTLLLDPFDKIIADKASKDEVQWDESLKISFLKAKEAIDDIQDLYLPSPHDQLLIIVDAAKSPPGLGHVLYAIKDGRKLPVAFHSVKLSESHSRWNSCELEALALATSIQSEYHILKESKKPIFIAPDSKAVADAANLIKKGQFSSNPRMQALITNINRIPIVVQHASGKNKLNQCGDFQSRNPSTCQAEHCSVCKFVQEVSETVLHPHAINAIKTVEVSEDMMKNVNAWKSVQEDSKVCQMAKSHIISGKTPSAKSGKFLSEVRRLIKVVDKDLVKENGMLFVTSKPNIFSNKPVKKVVIPSSHLPAVLWQLHTSLNHPPKSQLKSQFDRLFYSVGLHPELDILYSECHFCQTHLKIPSVTTHHTVNDTKVPGSSFHADVIKRAAQNIFIIRDNFSSFTMAKLIPSENHSNLKQALIDLLIPFKLIGLITVKVDNATGFKPLLDDKDPELVKLGIKVIATDVFNKNENSVVDKSCLELQQELVRLEPAGRPITNTTLQTAIQILNSKLRRNGQISAYEIYFNRNMHTGNSLNLDFDALKKQQTDVRNLHNDRHNATVTSKSSTPPVPGDIVIIPSQHVKHKARDTFLVTSTDNDTVKVQKILHSTSAKPNLRAKQYVTSAKRVHVTSKSHHFHSTQKSVHSPAPFNYDTSTSDSDDDDYYFVPLNSSIPHSKDVITANTTDNSELPRNLSPDDAIPPELPPQLPPRSRSPSPFHGFRTPPPRPPPTLSKRERQKILARQKINQVYEKEGRRHSTTAHDFLDTPFHPARPSHPSASSLEWDYDEVNRLADDVFSDDTPEGSPGADSPEGGRQST